MCGIFGWQFKDAGTLKFGSVEVLAASLVQSNETRGDDSWGYVRQVKEKFDIHKGLGEMTTRCTIRGLFQTQIVAHTRHATSGTANIKNAHPFEIGGLIGAHNGMVFNHAALNEKYKDRKCTVDSQHIFHHLAEELDLDELEMYGAIEWIDTRKNQDHIWLCRAKRGELAAAAIYTPGNKKDVIGCVWSSDDGHLDTAMEMSGFPWFFYHVDAQQLYYVKGGTLYTAEQKLSLGTKPTPVTSYSEDWRGGGGKYARYKWDNMLQKMVLSDGLDDWGCGHPYGNTDSQVPIPVTDHRRLKLIKSDDKKIEDAAHKIIAASGLEGEAADTDDEVAQCDGCNEWEVKGNVKLYPRCDQWLCFECATMWGQTMGDGPNGC